MGYTTDFVGDFEVTPPLSLEHAIYLACFSGTRRMERDAAKAAALPDPRRKAVGLPVGEHGSFFVGAEGFAGQERDESVLNGNGPPPGQPGLWCQWVPKKKAGARGLRLAGWQDEEEPEEGIYTHLGWDGGEKFYAYTEWLKYLVENFLGPWGYVLNGEVTWQGEERGDIGKIVMENNQISIKAGHIEWG